MVESPVKLSDDELKTLIDLQAEFEFLIKTLGENVYQHQVLKDELKDLDKQRIQIVADIESKYGTGSVDLSTGEFIPQ